MSTPLLSYVFPTQPSPLQVSPVNGSTNAYINVVASALGQSIYCQKIEIYVPVGTGNGYLTPNTPTVTPNTTLWSVAAAQSVAASQTPFGQSLPAAQQGINYAQFVCTCNDPSNYEITYDLQFSIFASPIDPNVGSYGIGIVEDSSPDGSTYTSKNQLYNLEKAPPIFFLNNFIATGTSGGYNLNEPSGQFAKGDGIQMSWESNGSEFKIFTSGTQDPVYSGRDKTFLLPNGIAQTTTYILQAQVIGGPQTGATGQTFENINLYESLTLVITNPDLVPSSIVASGDISTTTNLTADGLTSTDTLKVNSSSSTALEVTGGGSVTGQLTAGSAHVTGSLQVDSNSTLNDATINQDLTLDGTLSAQNASFTMLSEHQVLLDSNENYIQGISFMPNTDGIVMGYCNYPEDNYQATCVYWFFIVSGDMQVGGVGGNTPGDGSVPNTSNPATISLPVRNGNSFTIYSTPWQENTVKVDVVFKFFPFGTGSSTEQQQVQQLDTVVPEHKIKLPKQALADSDR